MVHIVITYIRKRRKASNSNYIHSLSIIPIIRKSDSQMNMDLPDISLIQFYHNILLIKTIVTIIMDTYKWHLDSSTVTITQHLIHKLLKYLWQCNEEIVQTLTYKHLTIKETSFEYISELFRMMKPSCLFPVLTIYITHGICNLFILACIRLTKSTL